MEVNDECEIQSGTDGRLRRGPAIQYFPINKQHLSFRPLQPERHGQRYFATRTTIKTLRQQKLCETILSESRAEICHIKDNCMEVFFHAATSQAYS